MTLSELLIDCCTRLNYPPDLSLVEANVKARLTAFLNQTQFEILGQPSYKRLLRIETPLSTATGVAAYGLPFHVDRIVAIIDRRRQRRLDVMSTDAYRRYVPNPDVQQGTPLSYAFDGWSSVQFQPTSADDVYVYSDAIDDGTVISCMAVSPAGPGSPNSDLWQRHSATLVGPATNGVLLSPAGNGYISDLTLNAAVKGEVVDVMIGKPPVRFVARIPKTRVRSRYAQIYLAPTPSGIMEFDVFAERHVLPLTDLFDESVLPLRFHFLLPAGARMKEYELRGDTSRYSVAKREFDTGLAFLNSWVSDQPDAGDQMTPDDGRFGGTSVLGAWFPRSGYR